MESTYRDNNYEPNQFNVELIEGEIGVEYQATNWKQKYPRHIRVPQPKIDLNYRGVESTTDAPIDLEVNLLQREYIAANSVAVPGKNEVVPTKSSRQQVLEELNQTHLNNLRRNLERRLQVAREKGDENLIRLLEAEFEQIA